MTVDDVRVRPLYKHLFPPADAPWLSFVGLCFKIAPFIQSELQARWIARSLSGRARALPSVEVKIYCQGGKADVTAKACIFRCCYG